jgi:hypothetical protein
MDSGGLVDSGNDIVDSMDSGGLVDLVHLVDLVDLTRQVLVQFAKVENWLRFGFPWYSGAQPPKMNSTHLFKFLS